MKITFFARSFGGFANKQDYVEEAEKLAAAIGDESRYKQELYYIVCYDSPRRLDDRHNEIWFVAI